MREVLFNIKSIQTKGRNTNEINVTTLGTVSDVGNGAFILKYNEEDSIEKCNVLTTMEVNGNSVVIKKKGNITVHFVFEHLKIYSTVYKTPVGSISMSLMPIIVDADVGETSGDLDLEYILNVSGFQVFNKLNLRY